MTEDEKTIYFRLFKQAVEENGIKDIGATSEAMIYRFADLVSAHAITSMQTEQEPVAYAYVNYEREVEQIDWTGKRDESFENLEFTPLFSHPAPVTSMRGDSEMYASLKVLAEIREILGVGHKPMMTELPDILRGRVKGVSDETTAYIARLEDALQVANRLDYTHEHKAISEIIRSALASKPSQLSTNTDGWVSAPKEPTEEMEYAGNQEADKLATKINAEDYMHDMDTAKLVYKAMLNAIIQDKGE